MRGRQHYTSVASHSCCNTPIHYHSSQRPCLVSPRGTPAEHSPCHIVGRAVHRHNNSLATSRNTPQIHTCALHTTQMTDRPLYKGLIRPSHEHQHMGPRSPHAVMLMSKLGRGSPYPNGWAGCCCAGAFQAPNRCCGGH
jgi:hypothetical protein